MTLHIGTNNTKDVHAIYIIFCLFKHQHDLVVQPFDGGPLFIKIVRFPFYPSYEIQGGVFLDVPLQLTMAWFSLKIICYFP